MTDAMASPVTREMMARFYERGRSRSIVIRLEGGTIKLRLKGTRRWFAVSVGSVWVMACRIAADEAKREKRLERQRRREEARA